MTETPPDPQHALTRFPPGEIFALGDDTLQVTIAPQAGGRIAQIRHRGVDQLAGYSESNAAMIGWGCYAMVPWAGRIRQGRFAFRGRTVQLPINLGAHAIHGVGFALPWQLEVLQEDRAVLSLQLPEDERWPFGGTAQQVFEVAPDRLRLSLTVSAGLHAMPACIGWHPWFMKPEQLVFTPHAVYPRDAEGIATAALAPPPPGPWDDCFVNGKPVHLHRDGRALQITANASHWVVYDEAPHATCVEPQSGPPDAFNLAPQVLAPGERLGLAMTLAWV